MSESHMGESERSKVRRSRYRWNPVSLHFQTDETLLHFLDWGEGSSRDLILLHGLGGYAHNWDGFATVAAEDFRVVVPDLRGHGESEHSRDGYTLDSFTSDIKALARYLNLTTINLIGSAMGGVIATQFAMENPALVNRLILADGCLGLDAETPTHRFASRYSCPLGFDTRDEAKAWLQHNLIGFSDGWLEQSLKYGMKLNWAGKWVFREDPELYWVMHAGSQNPQVAWQQFWETSLSMVMCPVLIMPGRESDLLSPEAGLRMVNLAKNATLTNISASTTSGHNIALFEQFHDAVLEFMAE